VKPAPDVVFQEVEGELVLLDLKQDHYFSLDEIGARVWALLVEHDGDVERVKVALLEEFEADEATLRSDVDALLARLSEAGLVAA
jgi:hypothetical protein